MVGKPAKKRVPRVGLEKGKPMLEVLHEEDGRLQLVVEQWG